MTTSSDFLPSLLLFLLLKTKTHDAYHDMLTHYISMTVNLIGWFPQIKVVSQLKIYDYHSISDLCSKKERHHGWHKSSQSKMGKTQGWRQDTNKMVEEKVRTNKSMSGTYWALSKRCHQYLNVKGQCMIADVLLEPAIWKFSYKLLTLMV